MSVTCASVIADAGKNRVIREQPLEPAEVHARGEHQQHHRETDRQPAPGTGRADRVDTNEDPSAADDRDEGESDPASHDGERQQPTGEEPPGRQREEIEGQRAAENGVDRRSRAWRIPIEGERRPRGRHASAGNRANDERQPQRDEPQQRLYRQVQRLTIDQNRRAGQFSETRRPERQKCAVQRQEGHDREKCEDGRLKIQRLPEHVEVPERFEPERFDVIRQRRPAAEHDGGQDDEEKQTATPASRTGGWPIDRFSHRGSRGDEVRLLHTVLEAHCDETTRDDRLSRPD